MRETLQDWDPKVRTASLLPFSSSCTASRADPLLFTPQVTAAAAIFLASKAEEEPRSLKTLLSWVLDPDELADPHRSNEARQKVLAHEEALLRVLCFDLTVRHPHWIAVSVAKRSWTGDEVEASDKVAKVAWMILNDSCVLASLVCPSCRVHC